MDGCVLKCRGISTCIYDSDLIVSRGPNLCVTTWSRYFDKRLGEHGAWVMLYFGTCPLWKGASINIAFSLDLLSWHKATEPLYKAGGHPAGLDKCEAHKVRPSSQTFSYTSSYI